MKNLIVATVAAMLLAACSTCECPQDAAPSSAVTAMSVDEVREFCRPVEQDANLLAACRAWTELTEEQRFDSCVLSWGAGASDARNSHQLPDPPEGLVRFPSGWYGHPDGCQVFGDAAQEEAQRLLRESRQATNG